MEKTNRDWENHGKDYAAHWAGGALAGVLTVLLPLVGIAFFAAQYAYQLESYWDRPDTLKLDLFDILLGYALGILGGLAALGWLLWHLYQRFS